MTYEGDVRIPVYLHSNACLNLYPSNTQSNFRIRFSKPLSLPGVWGVGLRAIQYPHLWNVLNKDYDITVNLSINVATKGKSYRITVKKGFYEDVSDLLEEINKAIKFKLSSEITAGLIELNVRFDPSFPGNLSQTHTGHISFTATLSGTTLEFPESMPDNELNGILGIGKNKVLALGDTISEHIAAISLHQPNLYIYTNIIRPVTVSGTTAPLLEIVPVRGRPHRNEWFHNYDPSYKRVINNHIEEMEIWILNDSGKIINFLIGKVYLELDFVRFA